MVTPTSTVNVELRPHPSRLSSVMLHIDPRRSPARLRFDPERAVDLLRLDRWSALAVVVVHAPAVDRSDGFAETEVARGGCSRWVGPGMVMD